MGSSNKSQEENYQNTLSQDVRVAVASSDCWHSSARWAHNPCTQSWRQRGSRVQGQPGLEPGLSQKSVWMGQGNNSQYDN